MTHTLGDVEDAIRRKFVSEGIRVSSGLRYDPAKVIEDSRCWYIPCGWIGCIGAIVNKDDLFVNLLGSGLSVEDSIWGHHHGLYFDSVDLPSPRIRI